MKEQVSENTVCAACGSLCDDLAVRAGKTITATVPGNGSTTCDLAERCGRGAAWLNTLAPLEPEFFFSGKPTRQDSALARAADLISSAQAPAVVGLGELTSEAITQAIALASASRALLLPEPPAPYAADRAGLEAPHAKISWGTVQAEADLVLFWFTRPDDTHPRFVERFLRSPLLRGGHRRVVLLETDASDKSASDGPAQANLSPGADLERIQVAGTDDEHDLARALFTRLVSQGPNETPTPGSGSLDRLLEALEEANRIHVFLSIESARDRQLWNLFQRLGARSRIQLTASVLPPKGNGAAIEATLALSHRVVGPTLFQADGPVPLGGHVTLASALKERFTDLVVCAGLDSQLLDDETRAALSGSPRIVFSPTLDPTADVTVRIPGLDPRLAASVVREDGIWLTLSGSSPGVPDPAVGLLAALRSAVEAKQGNTRP